MLMLIYIDLDTSVTTENVYIVTSPDSHCPWEYTAEEACLTLQQYAYDPSPRSNTTLRMESGSHSLQGLGISLNFEIDTDDSDYQNNRFKMTAEEAKLFYNNAPGMITPTPIISIRNTRYAYINGVTFISHNSGYIKFESVQDVFIEICIFRGVRLLLTMVDNATISRCSFSNYSKSDPAYVLDNESGAMYVSQSNVQIVQSNFSHNQHAIIYHNTKHDRNNMQNDNDRSVSSPIQLQVCSLSINQSIFSNNTSKYGGSALYVTGMVSVSVHQSVFLFNNASGIGGAISLSGVHGTAIYSISDSTFVYNSAEFCGAFSIDSFNGIVIISGSNFYYNSAESDDFGGFGGGGCIWNASISILNCRFLVNRAKEDAGALYFDESKVTVERSIFGNNSAGRDGGALYTYAHPSFYIITSSVFLHNKADDDGGVIFVGRKGSEVQTDKSTFAANNARDRGGAICLIGSKLTVTETNIFSNTADKGRQVSACNSYVMTFISGRKDPNFPFCAIYDNDIANAHSATPTSIECGNIICLNDMVYKIIKDYGVFGNESNASSITDKSGLTSTELSYIHQTAIFAYAALAVSAFLVMFLLLYIIILKVVKCYKVGRRRKGQYFLLSSQEQSD